SRVRRGKVLGAGNAMVARVWDRFYPRTQEVRAVADTGLRIQQAAALHRQAVATVQASAPAPESDAPPAAGPVEQRGPVEQLRDAARMLAPGWLGATLDAQSANTPLGGVYPPQFVRVGVAQPLDDAQFPAVVPLLGTGHLTMDASVTDERVFGL